MLMPLLGDCKKRPSLCKNWVILLCALDIELLFWIALILIISYFSGLHKINQEDKYALSGQLPGIIAS